MTTSILALALMLACGDKDDTGSDGSTTDGGATSDGGSADGGSSDGGTADGGTVDGGTEDGGTEDGGTEDGGAQDGGSEDGGTEDGGTEDGGTEDGGTEDGGSIDDCTTIDAPVLSGGAITAVSATFGTRTAVEISVEATDPTCTLPADHWSLVCVLSDGVADDGVEVERVELSADGVDLEPGASIPFVLDSEVSGSLSRFYEAVCAVQGAHGTLAARSIAATGNSLPSIETVLLDPAEPTSADAVTCSWEGFSDDDGDEDHSTILWTLDGLPFPGVGSTFTGAYKGAELACIVTPDDGYQEGTPVVASAEIQGSAPVITSVRIAPTTPSKGTNATCMVSYAEYDGDPLSGEYQWMVNGEEIEGHSAALAGEMYERGDEVSCTVRLWDEDGEAEATATATVGNAAPEFSLIGLDVEWPTAGEEDLVCRASAIDPDGDAVELSFAWTRDGRTWGGAAETTYREGDTVPADELSADEVWACVATATDGEDSNSESIDTVVLSPISDGQDGTLRDGDYMNTKGVVTAAGANLVVIEHPDGGPWSAITVWLGSEPTVSVGDYVLAYGPIEEYYEHTEISGSIAWLDSGWDLPEPEDLTGLDWSDADVMEPYESVLATVSGDLTVTDVLSGYGDWELDGAVWVDDRFVTAEEIERASGVAIETGATLDSVTGPVFYHYSVFRLTPRDADDVVGLTAP